MPTSLESTLNNLEKNKKYLLAISGGVDSMVLLDLFLKAGYSFSVAHCNFQLRGEESHLDEKYVRLFCEKHKIELFCEKFDTLRLKKNRESIEMIARNLRYSFFEKLIKIHGFDFLVTGHHANDQAETFFINLLRGAGLKGLSGMQEQKNHVLRPLLKISRKKIEEYATKNNIIWREDHTNHEIDYLRNKIRHNIIPELENIQKAFLEQIQKSMNIIKESYTFIEKKTIELYNECLISQKENLDIFSLEKLKSSDSLLVYYLFSSYNFTNKKDCENILNAKTGSIFLSQTHKIWINRNELIIEEIVNKNISELNIDISIPSLPFHIDLPFALDISYSDKIPDQKNIEAIDGSNLTFPLIIRKWKDGDYFYPINGLGKKKISKYLKDLKISNYQKEKIFVLCDGSGEIIWLIGLRLDNRYKITSTTNTFVHIKYNSKV